MGACHICKKSGVRTCCPEEAEVKCMICGYCEREAIKDEFKRESQVGRIYSSYTEDTA